MVETAEWIENFEIKPQKISTRDVHVYLISVTEQKSNYESLYSLLQKDEKERASRFRFKEDRERYVISRSILRKILGNYLNQDPEEVALGYTRYERPFLKDRRESCCFL